MPTTTAAPTTNVNYSIDISNKANEMTSKAGVVLNKCTRSPPPNKLPSPSSQRRSWSHSPLIPISPLTTSSPQTPPPHETSLNSAVTEHLNPRSEKNLQQRHKRHASLSSPSFSRIDTAQLPQTNTLLSISNIINTRITQFLSIPTSDLSGLLINLQTQTRISLEVIEESLTRWKWEELAISFNGGKDCLVLLVLLLAGIHKKYYCNNDNNDIPQRDQPSSIPSIYVSPSHPFPEVERFVSQCIKTYHLSPTTLPLPMKPAFEKYLQANKSVKAIFVGTRRTDPHGGNLTWFDRTDHGWPDFVRVHPVVDWHYQEVWAFLRYLSIPYCPLYDQGYTSLGGMFDTFPNPVLAIEDCEGSRKFRPAYELLEDGQERLGREINNNNNNKKR